MYDLVAEEVCKWFIKNFGSIFSINSLEELRVHFEYFTQEGEAALNIKAFLKDGLLDVGKVICTVDQDTVMIQEVHLFFAGLPIDPMSQSAFNISNQNRGSGLHELLDNIEKTHSNVSKWEASLTAFMNKYLLEAKSEEDPQDNQFDNILDLLGYLGYLKHYYEDLYHEIRTQTSSRAM